LVAKRGFFVIDKEGIVQGKWLFKGVFPSETILKKVRDLEGKR
jgi:peroxiredoxin